MKTNEIKELVGDIVTLDFDTLKEIKDVFTKLSELLTDYKNCTDINTLDNIKREIASWLVFLAPMWGEIKKHKGSNHTFLEDARKRLKAVVLSRMITSTKDQKGMALTTAKELVYNDIEFVTKSEALLLLKKNLITFEELFEGYQRVFQSILQSVSIEAKSFQSNV